MKFTWKVPLFHKDKLTHYNVFNNRLFSEAIDLLFSIPELSFEEFSETVKRKAQWQFCNRCEYEMVLLPWPVGPEDNRYKMDVFEQLEVNWDRFIDYLWDAYCFGESKDEIE